MFCGSTIQSLLHGDTTLSVVRTVFLEEVKGKPTRECCRGGGDWYFRDENLDTWLDAEQPDAAACAIAVCGKSVNWTFEDMVRSHPGAPKKANAIELGRWLIQSGHALTLPQVEILCERTGRGEDTGLRTIGAHGVFCVLETSHTDAPAPVLRIGRLDAPNRPRWGIGVGRLSHKSPMPARSRFLFRGPDTARA